MSTILPEKFDSGDFVNWVRQFNVCAAANTWNAAKKLAVLPAFLRGPAATYYHTLADGEKDTFEHLTTSLQGLLCPAVGREQYYRDFEQRLLRPTEDPSLFLWSIRDLLSKAEPGMSEEARTALLSRQFIKGLPKYLQVKLLEDNPTPSLSEMVHFVQRFRAIHGPDNELGSSHLFAALPASTKESASSLPFVAEQASLAPQIAELTAAVSALSTDIKRLTARLDAHTQYQPQPVQSRPYAPPSASTPRGKNWQRPPSYGPRGNFRRGTNTARCFNCHAVGHFARDCPYNQQCTLCYGWGHLEPHCANKKENVSTDSLNFKGVPQY
eukprot:gene5083-biopygen4144